MSKPVLLKRGLANSYEEWIMSAEYIMAGGNENVILCERGIRTFERATRNTLDLSAVAELKVTDKGGVEIKLIDRIRALEVLCGLLSEEKAEGAGELYRVLADAAGEEGAWDDG